MVRLLLRPDGQLPTERRQTRCRSGRPVIQPMPRVPSPLHRRRLAGDPVLHATLVVGGPDVRRRRRALLDSIGRPLRAPERDHAATYTHLRSSRITVPARTGRSRGITCCASPAATVPAGYRHAKTRSVRWTVLERGVASPMDEFLFVLG